MLNKKDLYAQFPAGVGAGFGQFGDAINVDFVDEHGSRAQRRAMEKILKKQAAKAKKGGLK